MTYIVSGGALNSTYSLFCSVFDRSPSLGIPQRVCALAESL